MNEDCCSFEFVRDRACFVLADGLGGHEKGEKASRAAVEFVMSQYRKIPKISRKALAELLEEANQCVIKGQTMYPGMRTTLAAAVIEERKFYFAHAGDSRVYLFKNGKMFDRSKDHSVPQILVDMGELREDQIRFHPDRNRLLKVLGNETCLNISKMPEPVQMEPGDAFLICSDGFWEYVWETEMEADLVKSGTAKEWIIFMTKRILLRAPAARDNFTAAAGIFR